MMIKKAGNGEFYLMRRSQLKVGGGRGVKKTWRFYNWFPVRARRVEAGCISIGNNVSVPKEFIGKKLRLKVEIIEE